MEGVEEGRERGKVEGERKMRRMKRREMKGEERRERGKGKRKEGKAVEGKNMHRVGTSSGRWKRQCKILHY